MTNTRFRNLALLLATLGAIFSTATVAAHDIGAHRTLVIDTDMGLDDAVTLAMALQNPDINIAAIVASEGVAGRQHGVKLAERMLHRFNRRDIPLYAPDTSGPMKSAPPFRAFAEGAIAEALPNNVAAFHRPFSPSAYVEDKQKTTILVLGPLTNLAAAFEQAPEIKQNIKEIIIAGKPDPKKAWNMRFDPDAFKAVQNAGVPLKFIIRGPGSKKPDSLNAGPLALGPGTAVGEMFLRDLLADASVQAHYATQFSNFHDELALLYMLDPAIFSSKTGDNTFAPDNRHMVSHLFTMAITTGRQHKHRVVLVDRPLPANAFQKDIRERRDRIILKNGRDEWFSQLLMNELHQHLGAYSIIGVKMGLRAAELLNAPQHGMKVVSHTPAHPPASCLNDGIIVATGSTPGRALFTHSPEASGDPRVSFSCNGRTITLVLKKAYRDKIKAKIRALLKKHSLEDHAYWHDVREFGLDIWENWHRRDIFDVSRDIFDANEKPASSGTTPQTQQS